MLPNGVTRPQWVVAWWHQIASWILVTNGLGNALLLDGTNPLPEPMMTYYQMQSEKQTLEKNFSENMPILIQENVLEMSLA